MNKKEAKRLAISFVIVLVVNILILSIVNSLQISYWENAPEEEVIYNMVAGENEKGIEYLHNDTNFNIDEDDVERIDRLLKDNSAIKLSEKESRLCKHRCVGQKSYGRSKILRRSLRGSIQRRPQPLLHSAGI